MILNIEKGREQKRPNVLIVDDNISCSILAASALLGEGCAVKIVHSGLAAAESVRTALFDLIVLDWNMPMHDGRKTLIILDKVLSHYSVNIPLILYTGVDAQKINLPHTKKIHLVDFWGKDEQTIGWKRKVSNIVNRMKGGKL